MAKLKDFITALAKKAGFDTATAEAKPFFDSLPDVDVPEEIGKGIDNQLISLTEAKNNFPELKNHYTKQTLDGVDKTLLSLIEDFQLPDDIKAEVLAETSTYKRGPLLTRKIVELERKKLSATGGKDKAAVQAEIDGLHAQLKATKDSLETEKKTFEQQRVQDKINNKKNVLFGGMKTIHDVLDPEVRFNILDSQLQKALQDTQSKLALDEHGNIVLMRNDGTNFFGENHQQVKPSQFIESVLAKNKQLVVSSGAATPANTTNGNPPSKAGGDNNDNKNAGLIARNNQAMADFETASKNGAFGG